MRAIAVMPQKRDVSIVNHEPPVILGPSDVMLKMLEAGVCGTDREICSFAYGTPPRGSEYLIIGHESLGEVIEAGPGVERLTVGDLVVPMVRRPCPHSNCPACRAGRQDFCVTGDYSERGIKDAHGYMTELVVDDERYMHVVPRMLREVAVLAEPLTIAQKALFQVRQIQQRLPWEGIVEPDHAGGQPQTAVVLGAGPVGLLGAMTLKCAGFDTHVYSRELPPNPKADLVESFGGHYASSAAEGVEALARRIGNIDLVYEATGVADVSFELMRVLGTNAVFAFTGVPGRKAPITLDADVIMRNLVLKNQVVFGTVNAGPQAYSAAIRDLGLFMERWPAAVRSLITGRYPMEAHRDLLLGKTHGIKNVIALT